jgi:hypothetical protein
MTDENTHWGFNTEDSTIGNTGNIALQFRAPNMAVMTISYDGNISFSCDLKPDEAAREAWAIFTELYVKPHNVMAEENARLRAALVEVRKVPEVQDAARFIVPAMERLRDGGDFVGREALLEWGVAALAALKGERHGV